MKISFCPEYVFLPLYVIYKLDLSPILMNKEPNVRFTQWKIFWMMLIHNYLETLLRNIQCRYKNIFIPLFIFAKLTAQTVIELYY
jgi:hypothetical protein